MRIAMVNQPGSVCPPENSADSIALVIHELTRRLARRCEVVCYAKALPGRPERETIEGVEYRRITPRWDRFAKPLRLLDKWKLLPRTKPFYQSVFYHLDFMRRVAMDLRKHPVHVVHVHNFAAAARVVRFYNPKVRTLLHMHCDWLCQLDEGLIKRRLQSVDSVMTVSQFLAENARRRFPERAGDIHTLYNGVDIDRFSPPATLDRASRGTRRILYVGRMSPEKGPHVLLQAFAAVSERFPDAQLELAGPDNVLSREFVDPGRQDPVLEKLSPYFQDRASYGRWLRSIVGPPAASRVHFVGSLSHQELSKRYQAADVLVVPSVFDEPFGMPMAEGLAAGLVVVATRAGAFPEIVEDGNSGLLVERANPAQLAERIGRIFSDPALVARMGSAASARAGELFSWDRLAEVLARRYEVLAAAPRDSAKSAAEAVPAMPGVAARQ